MNMYQQLLDQIAAASNKQESNEPPAEESVMDRIRKAAADAGFDVTIIGAAKSEFDDDDDFENGICPFCGEDCTEEEDDGFSDEFIDDLRRAADKLVEASSKFKQEALYAIIYELGRMSEIGTLSNTDLLALNSLEQVLDALAQGNPKPLFDLI